MHSYSPGAACGDQSRQGGGGYVPVGLGARCAVGLGKQRADESLAGRADQDRPAQRREGVEVGQQRPVVLGGLGESNPGVEHDPCTVDAAFDCRLVALPELVANLRHHVGIERAGLHVG